MFKNYLWIALRNLRRHKGYAFINVLGLAIGLACFVLILLFVQDELSYDRYHEKANRIYRVVEIIKGAEESSSQRFPVSPTLAADYPHLIEHSVRFFNLQAPTLSLTYETPSGGKQTFNEPRFFFADSTVFDVFDFPLVRGNPATALMDPMSIVLTESMAKKYFGEVDPIGRTIQFEGVHDLRITGVAADVPRNSHFRFDFLASFSSLRQILPNAATLESWFWNPAWTYVLLNKGVAPATLEAQFPGFVQKYFPEPLHELSTLYLQPLTDIHLRSRLDYEIEPNGSIAYVYIFSVIACLILLIACINFVNLTTARSAKRAREVGMRKVLGAYRFQLVRQFLGESVLMSLVGVLVALPLVWLLLPLLNDLSGKSLALDATTMVWILGGLTGVGLLVGLVSGLYPAVFLSAFRPAQVLKGSPLATRGRASASRFRQVLVVTQFALSIILIAGTIVAHRQLGFLRSAELGFDKEEVLMVNMMRSSLPARYAEFKDALLQHRNVLAVTISEDALGNKFQTGNWMPEGLDEPIQVPRLMVHDDVVEVFGIDMAAGRGYSREFVTDATDAILVNESFVHNVGWGTPQEAIGRTITDVSGATKTVIGVTKDFHFASLHDVIGPFILQHPGNNPRRLAFFGRYLAVRIAPENYEETLGYIEQQWAAFEPNRPIEYFFLDDNLDGMYRAETVLGQVATAFSLLAILVACLGLFGLASFMAEQRTKEIGIRKVLGASVSGLVALFSRGFVGLVCIAALIAWPLAYLALDAWLSSFAYQTTVGFVPLLAAALLALAIAWLTVSYQSVSAALADPVKSLRYE